MVGAGAFGGDPGVGTRAVPRAMMTEAAAIALRFRIRVRFRREEPLDGARALGAHKVSMLQDLGCGRRTEIEPIVGVVQRRGRLARIPMPAVDIVSPLFRQRAQAAQLGQAA